MFTHVIFDLDGTLLDTLEDLADATNWVCAQHGWPAHPVEAYKYFIGNGAAKLVERAAPKDVELTDDLRRELLEQFTQRYSAHKADKTAPYPGIPQALERLQGAGITMAVLTNKPDGAARPIVEGYFPGVFQVVQGSLPGVPTKPDPTALFNLMERIGAKAETTLFVGDSNVDIQTANNGGLHSCGVLWGFRTREELLGEGAEHLAHTAQELADLILN